MGIVESLEMRKRLCCGSMERELRISRKVVQELLKIPAALMERLTKWADLNSFLSSDRRWTSNNENDSNNNNNKIIIEARKEKIELIWTKRRYLIILGHERWLDKKTEQFANNIKCCVKIMIK